MAAILPEGQRIFIAANDHAHVDQGVVEWADVVGQVNVDPGAHVDPKVLVIGPSPLGRLMPGDFQSGVHYHEVDDTEDAIADALLLLMEDLPYRRMLERNARSYWDGFLAPTSVVRRIVQAAEYAAKGPS